MPTGGEEDREVPERVGHPPCGPGHTQALPGLFGTAWGARPMVATEEEVPGSGRAG